MKAGDIFYHNDYQFPDGTSGIKLLILLNTPISKEPYLFVETTSQQQFRSKKFGCNSDKEYFFIPMNKEWFNQDTWIKLETINAWIASSIVKDGLDGKFEHKNQLSENTFNAIKNCIKITPTIVNKYKKLILS